MNASPVLRRWLDLASGDDIVIDAADINHEAIANMWRFSPRDDEMQGVTAESVAVFILQILAARRTRLRGAAMVFYCWHDEQARQLRFSLVSASHGRLPFSCAVTQTEELSVIAQRVVNRDWLIDSYDTPAPDDQCEPFVLPIFVARIS